MGLCYLHHYFNDGRKAVLNASRISTEERRSLEAVGELGEIKVDLLRNKIFKSSPRESMEIEKSTYSKRDHLLEEQKIFLKVLSIILHQLLTLMMG